MGGQTPIEFKVNAYINEVSHYPHFLRRVDLSLPAWLERQTMMLRNVLRLCT